MISLPLRRELESVDWDFPQASDEPFRSQHWYPGTFPPELPSTLIQATTGPGDVVFDPYGGIGTASTEALRLGRRAWCVELNRVAAMCAYVGGAVLLLKRWYPERLDDLLASLAGCIAGTDEDNLLGGPSSAQLGTEIDEHVGSLVEPPPREFLSQVTFNEVPNELLFERWYHRTTLEHICTFRKGLAEQDSAVLQLLGMMALSACLRALSSQTRSWGHIADNVLPKKLVNKDFSRALRRWFGRFSNNLQNTQVEPFSVTAANREKHLHVSIHDWAQEKRLALPTTERARALITSPPYGGAIDYILSQRLSFYLLGAEDRDLVIEQRKEIGARRRRFSDKNRVQWAKNLRKSLEKQIDYVSPTGTIIVVMPHKSEGRSNGNKIVDDTLQSNNWFKQFTVDRSIRSQRTRQAWTSIKRETIGFYELSNNSRDREK